LEVLDYYKDRYNDELARFNLLEEKSARLLGFLSIMIGAMGAALSFKDHVVLHPHSAMTLVRMLLLLTSIVCVVCAWVYSLKALKVDVYSALPYGRDVFEWMTNEDVGEDARRIYIQNCYIDTLELFSVQNDVKARKLDLCYRDLTLAAWALGLFSVVTLVLEVPK